MPTNKHHFDQAATKSSLKSFFSAHKPRLTSFGGTVNQTFEAFVFAASIKWYRRRRWNTSVVNPKGGQFRLKFSTRGRPSNFSYVRCQRGKQSCQLRHQLRVTTAHSRVGQRFRANICCDLAVIKDINLDSYSTFDAIPNNQLITFAEAKHMSAFAELLASFLGVVHELQPARLKARSRLSWKGNHPKSFLYVSGILYHTAKGILETIQSRKLNLAIYSFDTPLN